MDAQAWRMLFEGAWVTAWISAVSISIGVILGLGLALLRLARIPVLDQLLATWISLARATPMVTLALFVFIGLAAVNLGVSRETAAILTLTINTSAFNAEIWRSAFAGFSREQKEAALACGMTPSLMFRRIMLPQMVVSSMPGLVNEMSSLVKSTPAIAIIGLVDLTRVTNRIAAVTYEPLPPILAAAVIYMVLIALLVRLQALAERRARRLAM
ncbi:amino acid ABC transporter permease [Bordetella genomosp. 11]|uniref:ABC transporter permease n=1 Tax=Bordetella genomosp. 11 TaxID=1416808 RepID=A0A261UIT6_9BORD|nr:amino acid ABC transporter permease [Bordetella genomosp. 11]OZI61834.1 ABC transporter permease [Bordetella genomosp. 11]